VARYLIPQISGNFFKTDGQKAHLCSQILKLTILEIIQILGIKKNQFLYGFKWHTTNIITNGIVVSATCC
jgi:hypothetical protein